MNEKEEAPHMSTKCSQCNNAPAITVVNQSHPLCLRCWKDYNFIMSDLFERNVRALNHDAAMMDYLSGMPTGFTPRYELLLQKPQTIIGEYKLTNIKIDRSAVGVINTGTIAGSLENIDASIELIKKDPKLKAIQESLKQISEAVTNATDASQNQKAEILELISALSDELRASQERRRPSAIKSYLKSISETVSAVASIAKAWDLIKSLFESLTVT
jgi:hypothetical protein